MGAESVVLNVGRASTSSQPTVVSPRHNSRVDGVAQNAFQQIKETATHVWSITFVAVVRTGGRIAKLAIGVIACIHPSFKTPLLYVYHKAEVFWADWTAQSLSVQNEQLRKENVGLVARVVSAESTIASQKETIGLLEARVTAAEEAAAAAKQVQTSEAAQIGPMETLVAEAQKRAKAVEQAYDMLRGQYQALLLSQQKPQVGSQQVATARAEGESDSCKTLILNGLRATAKALGSGDQESLNAAAVYIENGKHNDEAMGKIVQGLRAVQAPQPSQNRLITAAITYCGRLMVGG